MADIAPADTEVIERVTAAVYGSKWNDPKNAPGERMKDVWRGYAQKHLFALKVGDRINCGGVECVVLPTKLSFDQLVGFAGAVTDNGRDFQVAVSRLQDAYNVIVEYAPSAVTAKDG